jgi:DNA processing protein
MVALFGGFARTLEAGPSAIVARAAELGLRQEAVDYLARKPDLEELGLWAVSAAKGAGARVLVLGDPWYPPLLRSIEHPPPLLYVRGSLEPDLQRVAVVGSRDADDYGLEVARELGEGLALAGVQVVSGGARGVDAAAHAGALWGQGTTVAVLGCGIDIVYPPENAALFERLAAGGGAVISEFPPGTGPVRQNFPRRNRIISGLSSAVVVVQATPESGSLITANHAAAQRRQLFAVPGNAGAPLSSGPNQLLTRGAARAATTAKDLLQSLGWTVPEVLLEEQAPQRKRRRPQPQAPAPAPAEAARSGTDELVIDEEEGRLWNLLDEKSPAHVDELSIRSGIPVQQTLAKLSELEIKGLAVQRPGKYFLRRGS